MLPYHWPTSSCWTGALQKKPLSLQKVLSGKKFGAWASRQKKKDKKSNRAQQKNKRGDSKVESNDSPGIPDRGGNIRHPQPRFRATGQCFVQPISLSPLTKHSLKNQYKINMSLKQSPSFQRFILISSFYLLHKIRFEEASHIKLFRDTAEPPWKWLGPLKLLPLRL